MAEERCRSITAEEKRLMVQNFAHVQPFCLPGAKGNYFADTTEVPRCEAACVVCARNDYLEHRHKLNLFAQPPEPNALESVSADCDGTGDEHADKSAAVPTARSLIRRNGVCYVRSPEQVHKLLTVTRHAERRPPRVSTAEMLVNCHLSFIGSVNTSI